MMQRQGCRCHRAPAGPQPHLGRSRRLRCVIASSLLSGRVGRDWLGGGASGSTARCCPHLLQLQGAQGVEAAGRGGECLSCSWSKHGWQQWEVPPPKTVACAARPGGHLCTEAQHPPGQCPHGDRRCSQRLLQAGHLLPCALRPLRSSSNVHISQRCMRRFGCFRGGSACNGLLAHSSCLRQLLGHAGQGRLRVRRWGGTSGRRWR